MEIFEVRKYVFFSVFKRLEKKRIDLNLKREQNEIFFVALWLTIDYSTHNLPTPSVQPN